MGRDGGQGYHFSHPVVAEQFAKLLETGLSATVLNKRLSHRCSSRISLTFRDPSIAVAVRKTIATLQKHHLLQAKRLRKYGSSRSGAPRSGQVAQLKMLGETSSHA